MWGPRVTQGKYLLPDLVGPEHLMPKGLFSVAHSHDSVGELGLEEASDLGLASDSGIECKGGSMAGIGVVDVIVVIENRRVVVAPDVAGIHGLVSLPVGSLRVGLLDLAPVGAGVAGRPLRAGVAVVGFKGGAF
jgi:hypothetical protein